MNTTLYKLFFNSAQRLKRRLGIENFEAFKKKNKRKINRLFYRTKYNTVELIDIMKSMGMTKGSVIFIHSSMTEFYNYNGNAVELINEIIKEIGEDGTLLMPAYPKLKNNTYDVDFDVINSKSGAGYLSEVFRKMPGVKRSINLQHSVCAYGKLADELVANHHLSKTAWDKDSPYYKMCEKNALVFSFGLPDMLGTFIHCTESLLKDKYKYFEQFFTKKIIYKYKDYSGNILDHEYYSHDFARRTNKKFIINKYFDKGVIKQTKLSNLTIKMVPSKYTLNKLIELADNGVTIFTIPSPTKYKTKEGKFIRI